MKRAFTAHFWFNGWNHISLGLHIDYTLPNIEIHLPFGFFRLGWVKQPTDAIYLGNRRKFLFIQWWDSEGAIQ